LGIRAALEVSAQAAKDQAEATKELVTLSSAEDDDDSE